ncbi:MAG: hypothetical protein ACI9UA_003079 [Pseudoalteromonas tetraodonis]
MEKPVSNNVSEGRPMVEFARKHEKIVQTGTQCRSSHISYRLGQKKSCKELDAALKSDPAVVESFGRTAEHLAANKVDIAATPVTLGMPLTMDPATETFPGNGAANAMRTRPDRAPFVVPDKA